MTDGNEPFCFVNDASVSLNASGMEPTSTASQLPTDTETEEEQKEEDGESENTETAVKGRITETPPPPPVPTASSLNDPDNLLTSVRLVIGASSPISLFSHKHTM